MTQPKPLDSYERNELERLQNLSGLGRLSGDEARVLEYLGTKAFSYLKHKRKGQAVLNRNTVFLGE